MRIIISIHLYFTDLFVMILAGLLIAFVATLTPI